MIVGGYDLESTGLNEPDHRILEVCVKRFEWDGTTATPLDCYVERIDPERSIDAKAQAVHGITSADLIGKPKWTEVAPRLFKSLDSCDVVVAHNGMDFDFTFTIRELERIGHAIPDFEPYDTMIEGRWATPWGKSPSLSELAFSCGIPYDPALAHAAEYDVDVMMQSYFNGVRRGVFKIPAST